MCADNDIGGAGAASLAPSLSRMTQLTSLDLSCTLHASAASCAVSGCMRTPAVRRCCVLWAGAVACRAVAGSGDCEGAGRGAAVRAGNRIGDDGAASLAPSLLMMTQLTSLNLYGALMRIGDRGCCVGGFLRPPFVHG